MLRARVALGLCLGACAADPEARADDVSSSGGPAPVDAGSGGAGGSGGDAGVGSAGGTSELRVSPIFFSPLEEPVRDIEEGADVPLHAAPQGGHVLLLGARIEGLDNGPDYWVRLTSRVRDPDTHAILVEDSRTVVTAADPERPGARISDRRTDSQFSHAALCPAYGARDVVDARHLLELRVEELYGDQTTGVALVGIVPRCTEGTATDQTSCRCECRRDYVLGRCEGDGGA